MSNPTSNQTPDKDFSFRWGVDLLDEAQQGTFIYRFILQHYAALGVEPDEMMFIVHLSDYKYDSARGVSKPSLSTIGRLMGHDTQYARRLKKKLMQRGLLHVVSTPGFPDEYNFSELSQRALRLWSDARDAAQLATQLAAPIKPDTPIKSDRGRAIKRDRTPLSNLIDEEKQSTKQRSKARTSACKPPPAIQQAVSGKLRAKLSLNPQAPSGMHADDADIAAVEAEMKANPFRAFLPELVLSDEERRTAFELAQLFGYSNDLIGQGAQTKKQRTNERERWYTIKNLFIISKGDASKIIDAARYFKECLYPQYSFKCPDSLRNTLITWIAKTNASPEGDEIEIDNTEYVEVDTPFGKVLQPVGA